MRKIITLLFALMSLSLAAQTSTTDCFTVSDVTLAPDGTVGSFVVSLSSENIYSAYNLDIELPAGINVARNSSNALRVTMLKTSNAVYPYTEDVEENDEGEEVSVKTYSHTVACAIINDNTLRIACYSTISAPFKQASGDLLRVYLTASPYAKGGLNDIHISGCNLTTAAAVKYVPADVTCHNITVAGTSSVALNISAANQWSTCVLPFAHTPEGFTAYRADGQFVDGRDTYVQLVAVTEMMAYKPYIVYAASGFSGTLSGTVDGDIYPDDQNGVVVDGLLKGAIVPTSITSGYVLQNQGEGAMFHNVNGQSFSIPAGKCWLDIPASVAPRIIMTTHQPTAVEHVATEAASTGIYTLTGIPVAEPIPGNIYIKNGQKVICIK